MSAKVQKKVQKRNKQKIKLQKTHFYCKKSGLFTEFYVPLQPVITKMNYL